MKVQAIRDTYIAATYRKGPEFNADGVIITPGDVFDVPDDFVVNPEVLKVIEPPANKKVRFAKLPQPELPQAEIDEKPVQPSAPALPPANPAPSGPPRRV